MDEGKVINLAQRTIKYAHFDILKVKRRIFDDVTGEHMFCPPLTCS